MSILGRMNVIRFAPGMTEEPTADAIPLEEWRAQGAELFGDDYFAWQFQCPACGHVAKVGDFEQYKNQGATHESATEECIGRYQEGSRCDYAGYGLFGLSPVRVLLPNGKARRSFAFAKL
jgi:hypothetical protein